MSGSLATLGRDLRSGFGTATAEIAGVRSGVRGVKRDIKSVHAAVEECRAENSEFFKTFTSSLEATLNGIEGVRVCVRCNRHYSSTDMFGLKSFRMGSWRLR